MREELRDPLHERVERQHRVIAAKDAMHRRERPAGHDVPPVFAEECGRLVVDREPHALDLGDLEGAAIRHEVRQPPRAAAEPQVIAVEGEDEPDARGLLAREPEPRVERREIRERAA